MEPSHGSPHTTHHEVWSLLPWHVNGALKGPELALVQEHLQFCITCRKELVVQRRLAKAVRNSSVIGRSPQVAFARLRKRIARRETRWWRRCQSLCLAGWARLSDVVLARRAALALSLLLLIGLVFPPWQWLASVNNEPKYHTLADSDLSAARKNDIRVVFAETVEQEQIRQLLLAVRAQIIEGPSSVGAYTLRIAPGEGAGRDTVAALERLRRDPGVLLAEPTLPIAAGSPSADSRP